jgi:ribosomal protein S18 acetylase RimI-like enzyme
MSPGIRIRQISECDWDGIAALEAGTYSGSGLSEGRVALESRAYASPATCFVLEAGQQVAGYVLSLPYPEFQYPDLTRAEKLSFHSPNLHLHDLVIADDFRGRGFGKRLLHHLTETAEAKMYRRISLVAVGGSNTFWSANGYHAHPELTLPGGYGANALYMSRVI